MIKGLGKLPGSAEKNAIINWRCPLWVEERKVAAHGAVLNSLFQSRQSENIQTLASGRSWFTNGSATMTLLPV